MGYDYYSLTWSDYSTPIRFEYVGYDPNRLIYDGTCINTYFNQNELDRDENIKEMPEIYKDFFEHLIPNEKDRTYAVDWLAESLTKKLNSYLTLIGIKGPGKGIFSDIGRMLHGDENFVREGQKVIDGDFNGAFENRTLICLDEIAIKTEEQENTVKDLVNPTIQIRKKYKNVITSNNFANIIININQINMLKISEDERRYATPELTNIPLKHNKEFLKKYSDKGDVSEIVKEKLLNRKNILKLYSYLRNRKIVSNLDDIIENEHYRVLQGATKTDWQLFAIDYVMKNEEVKAKVLKEKIENNIDLNVPRINKNTIVNFFMMNEQKIKFRVVRPQNVETIRYIGE